MSPQQHNRFKHLHIIRIKSYIFILFVAFAIAPAFSQHKFALDLGYKYNRLNSGYLGAEYRLDSNAGKHPHGPLNIGAGTLLYSEKGKFELLPEFHINKTWKHVLISELSLTPKYVSPSLGITFFNLARFQFGYSVPLRHSDFKGFSFGLHILIGRSPFYDEITVY